MITQKILLVGCGGIADVWLKTLVDTGHARVVGLVDLNPGAAQAKAEKFGLEGIWTGGDLDAALAQLRPDVVFDCTVPSAHHRVALTALARGCHLMSEKPLAETMPQAREMVAASARSGKRHGVMQNRRWLPGIRRVRQALDQGIIGRVHSLHSDFFIGAHFGGFREEMAHVLLLDMAIHSFDQARFLLQARPLSVIAAEWNPPGSWYRHGAAAAAIFEMDGGRAFTYRGSWCAEGLPTSWECTWRIIGDRGTLLWDGGDGIRAEVVDGSEGFIRPTRPVEIPPCVFPAEQEGHAGAIRDFLDSIAGNREPATPASDNLFSLAMVHAAIESADTGRRVHLSPQAPVEG